MIQTTRFFNLSAKIFFALTIILTPFRWRLEFWSRPMPPLYSDYTDYLLFASDFVLIYMLIFWGCSLFLHPRKLKAGNALVWICLVGLTIAGVISVFGSVDYILSRYHAFRFILLLLLYLYIVNEVQSPVWVIVPIALQIIIQVPVAFGQSLAQTSLGLTLFGEHLLNPQILGTSIISVNDMRFLRAYGLSDHPNILGGCIAFGMILLFAVVLYGKKRLPLFCSIIFLISFPALIMTFSRSAWLSLMVGISFMVVCEALVRRWESVKRAIVLGMLSLIVVSPFLSENLSVFQKRINSGDVSQDGPMQERAYLLQAGNTLFVKHLAIGIGLGASPSAMEKRFAEFPGNYQPPHYIPLLAAMETGVLGGIFYMTLFLLPVVTFFSKWRIYIQHPLAIGAFALLFAISIVSLFDYYTWFYQSGRLWQWLAWGLFSVAIEKVK